MRIRIVDAFTDRPFAGNPAAVCLLDGPAWPDEAWLAAIAAEMNLPMTAFARPLPAGDAADWALRWFNAAGESGLCGHATLATAHVLHGDRGAAGTVRFATRGGLLTAHSRDDGNERSGSAAPGEGGPGSFAITLDFPAAPPVEVAGPADLADALGVKPEAVYGTGALGDLLAVFPDEAAVHGLSPDLVAVARMTRRDGLRGVIVTAPAAGPGLGHDFVSRFFAPADGLPEDPVTGSAHTALAPYWTDRLGRDYLVGLQASARTGLVGTAVHGNRVHLTGRAVTVLDGVLRSCAR